MVRRMRARWLPLVLCCLIPITGCRDRAPRIPAGGATFVEPLIQDWAAEHYRRTGVEIDYQRKGSGYGIQQMTERTIDFGCTDAPMSAAELDRARGVGGEVLQIPLALGAIAVVYSLPGLEAELVLSGPVLADIFRRKITHWNDPSLIALNPVTNLPPDAIVPVYRAESSGTSHLFTSYLGSVSEGFRNAVGVDKKPRWPEGGLAQEGSDGVVGHVRRNRFTIGYAEVLFAKRSNVAMAKIVNRSGNPVLPETENVLASAESNGGESAESFINRAGEKSYPIVGLSFAVFYRIQPRERGKILAEFFRWATAEGQIRAESLGYAPLPPNIRSNAASILDRIHLE